MEKAIDATDDVVLRWLESEDFEEALDWRMEVLGVVFEEAEPWNHAALRKANGRFIGKHLGSDLVHCIASYAGEDAGCGAICFQDELPSPDNREGWNAYLMNIYTRPAFRGHGIGRAVVAELIARARERGAGKIYLETTAMGAALYEGLGFVYMEGMMRLEDAAGLPSKGEDRD